MALCLRTGGSILSGTLAPPLRNIQESIEEQEKRWTARRKTDILRQTTTVVDVARTNDLTPSEVQGWVDTFLKNGENGLKTNSKDIHAQYQREIKDLKEAIGELYIDNAILKRARALWGKKRGRDRILPLKANCSTRMV